MGEELNAAAINKMHTIPHQEEWFAMEYRAMFGGRENVETKKVGVRGEIVTAHAHSLPNREPHTWVLTQITQPRNRGTLQMGPGSEIGGDIPFVAV